MTKTFISLVTVASIVSPLSAPAEEPVSGPRKRTADEVLVVYNAKSPISKSVADDYAKKRGVTNILAIQCIDAAVKTDNETVSLDTYTDVIEKPIRDYLKTNDRISFIVLTKGVPLRITGANTGERPENSKPDTPLRTCVDSHLAALGYVAGSRWQFTKITGSGATGAGWQNLYWNTNEPFTHRKFGGYLVTRLDGYTEADAKALVDRALEAEKGLADGKILFDVQPGFGLGKKEEQPARIRGEIKAESPWSDYNADMRLAHDLLVKRGIADELELTEKFVGGTNLLGYFSWGSNDAKFSAAAYKSLTFLPGSIGDTAVSTSGRTFLPTKGGQSLIADLVSRGLTCAKGYTDEPLLQANASPTILLEHYTAGYTMAESFYAASHFVGWQDVIIGDPLCCPYWEKLKTK